MRNYEMPPDTDEEEKVIGGVLTLRQFFCLLFGGILAGILAGISFKLSNSFILFLIVFILLSIPGILLAFVKKMGLTLFRYLLLRRKFHNKEKVLLAITKEGLK